MTKYFIGVDIGGTNTKIALVTQQGEISHLCRIATWCGEPMLENLLNRVSEAVDAIIAEAAHPIFGIGIAVPGLQMITGDGPLYTVNLPFLSRFNLKKYFADRYQIPVQVSNDLVAHSLAESYFGAGKGVDRLLSVSLGTGVGHIFVDHGVPLVIVNGISGDSGRMILDPHSDLCDSSGIYGSADALCGVKAIETLAQKLYPHMVTYKAKDVISAACEKNDPIAQQILTIVAYHTGHLLMNLSSIFFPEVIVLTGGQVEAGEFFMTECRKEFARLSARFFDEYFHLNGQERQIQVIKSQTGGLTGLIGSIIPFLSRSYGDLA